MESIKFITREEVENEKIECEDGVIVLLAPEGVPTTRYIRSLAGQIVLKSALPQRTKRYPHDGKHNSYQYGSLYNTQIDEED